MSGAVTLFVATLLHPMTQFPRDEITGTTGPEEMNLGNQRDDIHHEGEAISVIAGPRFAHGPPAHNMGSTDRVREVRYFS